MKKTNSAFYTVWSGQLVSLLGSGAASLALSLEVFNLTQSGLILSLTIGIRLAVSIYCAPFIGVYIDAFSKKSAVVFCDLALAVIAVALACLSLTGGPIVFILIALVAGGFFDCGLTLALTASIKQLRNESDLSVAASTTAALEAIPALVAPAVGAAIYTIFSASVVFAVDAMSFLVAAILAYRATWPPLETSGSRNRRPVKPFSGAGNGLRIVLSYKALRTPQLAASVINMSAGITTPIVLVLLIKISQGSSRGLGVYNTTTAIGTLVGALVVSWLSRFTTRSWLIFSAACVGALLGRAPLALSSALVVLAVMGFVRGAALSVSNTTLTAVWLERIPQEMQGSVFASRRLLAQGPYPISVLVGGALAGALAGHGVLYLGWTVAVFAVLEVAAALWQMSTPEARQFIDGAQIVNSPIRLDSVAK